MDFQNILDMIEIVTKWNFLTNHGRALLCIVHDPDTRLRDIAANLGITERRAYALVSDLTDAGYVIKEKDGRRNRYLIQHDLPIPEIPERGQSIGEVLHVLAGSQLPRGPRKHQAV